MQDVGCHKQTVNQREGMNMAVVPDPEPFSVAGGSGDVAPCSYLRIIPRYSQSKEVAEGGGKDRPSTLPSATDQDLDCSDRYEIESDGKTRLKNTRYLIVNVANGRETDLRDFRQKFPHLKILRLPNYSVLGEELSIYIIDRGLTFYNFKARLKP